MDVVKILDKVAHIIAQIIGAGVTLLAGAIVSASVLAIVGFILFIIGVVLFSVIALVGLAFLVYVVFEVLKG